MEKYDNDGEFVRSFGEGILKNLWDISVVYNGYAMVVDTEDFFVHISAESLNWNVHMGIIRLSLHFIERVHISSTS